MSAKVPLNASSTAARVGTVEADWHAVRQSTSIGTKTARPHGVFFEGLGEVLIFQGEMFRC
jgi:hypothetical protein